MKKNKLISALLIASTCLAVMPFNVSFAAGEPAVEREYITRKIGGVVSEEEKLCVAYDDLHIVDNGYYAKISFCAQNGYVVKQCQVALTKGGDLPDEMFLGTDELSGVAYARIELVGPNCNFSIIEVPFKI